MQLSSENGQIKLVAGSYQLTFPADRPYAILHDQHGERLVDLFYLSSVHTLHDRDDSTGMGAWEIQEAPEEIELSLSVESSIWMEKIVRFVCHPDHLSYSLTVSGRGSLAEVNYFGGYSSASLRWGTGFFYSGQSFQKGFNPEPNSKEASYFQPGESQRIDMQGVPLPGREHWFFTPPPFCYAFETKNTWLGIGVTAQAGANSFTEYDYCGQREAFHLHMAYDGQTQVDGTYQLPTASFYFSKVEYEILRQHVQDARAAVHIEQAAPKAKPIWWYEPIFCGWGAQCCAASLGTGRAPDYSRQDQYDNFLSTLESCNIHPGIVVVDDKWQLTYGDNRVDAAKWPDLREFIQRQHHDGRKVLLWLKAWDPEGIPAEECVTNARGKAVAVDPTHPAYEARLRNSVRQMLSGEEYDADGFKIDFSARIPAGPGLKTFGGLWGLELMRCYLSIIYDEAKRVKPDALVMAHTPHPYLADVVDMIRLNDINRVKDINKAMIQRAKIATIACPDAIIDTDNWPLTDKAAWRDYVLLQPDLGVPSLYYTKFIDTSKEQLDDDDFELIRDVWNRHRAKAISSD